jgi:Leucine-rich repeat (LRR) protein
MGNLQQFPFAQLAAEGIVAEHDACSSSTADPKALYDHTSRENTIGRWLHLRSDTKEERAERKAWPKRIQQFTSLKCLSVNGCTPELFESICMLPALMRLSIVRGRLSELESLKRLSTLTHFYYVGSPKLTDLDAIGEVKSLVGLSLTGNFAGVRSLAPLANLTELLSLALGANDFTRNTYDSLAPVGKLQKLRHLAIFSTKLGRDGLFPIAELKDLEYLYLDKHQLGQWSAAEYQHLHTRLPRLRTNLIELAATDREFQKQHRIRA